MKSNLLYLLILQAASTVSVKTRCPSWFNKIGKKYLAATPDLPGIQMSVSSLQDGIECRGSWISPFKNFTTSPPLLIDAPYRLASVTKTFTSVTALKLVERGIIQVNGSIIDYLPGWASEILIATQGAENASQITPWMLMHHTGGLDDFSSRPEYLALWSENPDFELSLEGLLLWARDHLGPVALPGTLVHYSDLGYAYLGAVISHVTGLSLAAAVREAVQMDSLGMDSLWWDILEEPPAGATPRAGQWMGTMDITDIHGSVAMWGGTGLIGNSDDMVKFARATHQGLLLGEAEMKMLYTTVPMPVDYDPEVGCGWMHNTDVGGLEAWYHRGGLGSFMYYFPERDLAVTGTINQINRLPLIREIVPEVVQNILNDAKCSRAVA
ncbi:serine hydrolase domain-containing protein [Aspergillus lucknowensis]|uniref:Beta-lactamase/transpeptidase-like protein n=1 Tax=Aspergillus lucknowensis TaxID=176173 RepID=A0ABR4LD93_9EURO